MLKMAFRNLNRNRRRSILTISAIVIAISFITLMLAWINGAREYDNRRGEKTKWRYKDYCYRF